MNLDLAALTTSPEPKLATPPLGGGVVAGLDIGGTSTHLVLFQSDRLVAEASAPTPSADGGKAMIDQAIALVRETCAKHGFSLQALGIGAAGVVDSVARKIVAASATFPGWAGFEVGAVLDDSLGVPNTLENDVNAFLIGELTAGAARGLSDVAGITLGTGVGGAIVLGGELWDGPSGAAGEIGHTPGFVIAGRGEEPCTCGQRGHLESIASGRSITRRYLERCGSGQLEATRALTTSEVAQRARSHNDEAARAVFFEAGLMVGQAAVMIAAILDVTTLVVGGGVARSWDLLGPGIGAFLAQSPPVSGRELTIVPATLGERSVATGAAAQAAHRLDQAPSIRP